MEEEKNKENQKIDASDSFLMLGTALFFDSLQWLLNFIFLGWIIMIFAGLTFFLWFRIKGIGVNIKMLKGVASWTWFVVSTITIEKAKKLAGSAPGGGALLNKAIGKA